MERNKKILIFLIILLLIAGGIFLVKTFFVIKVNVPRNQNNNQAVNPNIDMAKQQEFDEMIKQTAASDQDLDGLPDTEESKYKTNPLSSDTDNDGLTDWQEIFIYETDPLKSDTDNDSYADGYEVRRDFNPKGAGRLQIKNQ
ncbi:MAG: hypothetical protein HYT15_02970 [Candidatus Magasanikbacteria bacterium]|nr:hypothetical protein [Candidatus Magasanikbacteria bacterium]